MAQKITVRNKQNLLDIAVQETGSFEAVIDLMKQNALPITEFLTPGQAVLIEENRSAPDIKGYYKGNKIYPATGLTTEQQGHLKGISIWRIGVDFKVSK